MTEPDARELLVARERARMEWLDQRIRVQRRLVIWLVVAAFFQAVSLLIQAARWVFP